MNLIENESKTIKGIKIVSKILSLVVISGITKYVISTIEMYIKLNPIIDCLTFY
ncbi:hypothetical protein C8N41_1099 [Winogradskyella sediminis]|nr:hypothetical protein C8N41_1099 [Winogradskyella sediminis]